MSGPTIHQRTNGCQAPMVYKYGYGIGICYKCGEAVTDHPMEPRRTGSGDMVVWTWYWVEEDEWSDIIKIMTP